MPDQQYGFVRLRCKPTSRPIDRLALFVEGPETAPERTLAVMDLVPLRTTRAYGQRPVLLSPRLPVTTPGQYRTCYAIYLESDPLNPIVSNPCRDDALE